MAWKRIACIALMVVGTAACTPGAQSAPSTGVAGAGNVLIVNVSLLTYGPMASPFGSIAGYSPALIVVAHGTPIQFHNQDSFNHTSSRINTPSFPGANPLPLSAQNPSGTDVSQMSWSSGILTGNAFSKTFATAVVGTYLFGCQIHYPAMRGVIIVQ